jgi:hypothetical protein
MNFTAQPHTLSYRLRNEGMTSTTATAFVEDQGMEKRVSLEKVTLPPFAVFVGEVR